MAITAEARIVRAAKAYRKEAQLYSEAILKAPTRAKLVDLLFSYQATVWFHGRCDMMVDLCRGGHVSEEMAATFADQLAPGTGRRDQVSVLASQGEETTEVLFSAICRRLLRSKAVLFLCGMLGAVSIWDFVARIFR